MFINTIFFFYLIADFLKYITFNIKLDYIKYSLNFLNFNFCINKSFWYKKD